jgi:hypothetical protein
MPQGKRSAFGINTTTSTQISAVQKVINDLFCACGIARAYTAQQNLSMRTEFFDVTNNYNLSSGSRLTRREIFELFFAFFLQFFESVARKETLFAFKL